MFHCRTERGEEMRRRRGGEERREDGDKREKRKEETGWWWGGEENLMQIDKDLLTHHTHRMVTRGRGELYANIQRPFNPISLCFIVGQGEERRWEGDEEERREDGDKREKRKEETGWWRGGEENLMQIDKDLLTHYRFHYRTHTRDGDKREERRGELDINRQGPF